MLSSLRLCLVRSLAWVVGLSSAAGSSTGAEEASFLGFFSFCVCFGPFSRVGLSFSVLRFTFYFVFIVFFGLLLLYLCSIEMKITIVQKKKKNYTQNCSRQITLAYISYMYGCLNSIFETKTILGLKGA